MAGRKLSFAAVAVLQALQAGHQYGFEIIDVTGLGAGTVYPTLAKLEDAALVSSQWEAHETAQHEKRPPRRYYTLRAAGARALAAGLERYRAIERIPLVARRARR
jgi:PadR family transcriptional regulator, regulatory protein PadR